MRGSFRLGRIAGIEIGVHYTWLLAFFLITWSLAVGFFPRAYPGWDRTTYWLAGVLSALLLFASVLAHELAHSLVAQARGLSVKSITLFIFGGVSNIEQEPEKPSTELSMAIVGPLTSLVLAGLFFVLGRIIGNRSPLGAIINYLWLVNLILGIFNLLPGLPLDGGRVFRAIVWSATGNLARATNLSAMTGRFLGWAFIGVGVFLLLSGDLLGGLWTAFIGWFLNSAADATQREMTLQRQLTGVVVREIMEPNPETIDPQKSVEAMVRDCLLQRQRRAVPVVREGRLVGIVTLTDVKRVPQERWASTTVQEIMTRDPLYSVQPQDDLNSAMKLLAQHDLNQVLVMQDGKLAGLLSRADIIRYLQVSQELGMKPRKAAVSPP